jgi:HSP20 family molecular chaperone IbpA
MTMIEFVGFKPADILDVGRARPQLSAPPSSWTPTTDVYELGDELVIEIELPGSQNDKIKTNVIKDEATIKTEQVFHIMVEGRRDPLPNVMERFHNERWQGNFARLFRVPVAYDDKKISVVYDDGLLRITVAKKPDPSFQLTTILDQIPKTPAGKLEKL